MNREHLACLILALAAVPASAQVNGLAFTQVPALDDVGLIALVALVGGVGGWLARRRK
jgi:hypothetical protein